MGSLRTAHHCVFMDSNRFSQNTNGNYYGSPDNPMGTNPSLAKGSFICGFISLGLAITAIFSIFSIPVSAIGMMLGFMSSRRGKNFPRKATTGIIASSVGLVIALAITVSVMATVFSQIPLKTFIDQYSNMYEQIENGNYDYSNFAFDYDGFSSFKDYLDSAGTIQR